MQWYNFFAVPVSGTSLFKTRLKPRLIKNKFSQKKLNLINFLGTGTTLLTN